MSGDECPECGERLEVDEEWIIRDPELLGTEAGDRPLGEVYLHRECASDGHIARVLEVTE